MRKTLTFMLGVLPLLCLAQETAAETAPESVPGLFGTLLPYLLIAGLVIAAIVMCFMNWSESTEKIGIVGIPVCLAAAALLEILALYSVGNKAIWWCDPDRYGFWGGFFRFIPLMLVLIAQIISIYTYQTFLSKTKAMYDKEVSISLKPAAIALVIALPAAFVVAAILQWGLKVPKFIQEIGLLATLFGILFLGLGKTAKNNMAQFGSKYGLIITLFAIIYLLGVIAVVWLLIVGIFQMIIQEAILLILAYFFLFKTGILADLAKGAGGSQQFYVDDDGFSHTSLGSKESANRQIRERKEQKQN